MTEHITHNPDQVATEVTQSPEDDQALQYELFVGHARTDGTPKSSDQLRTEYIRRTDELIRKITDGVEFTDPVTGEKSVESPDFVVYLDKSARPVSWLVKEFWPKLAATPGEPAPEMPQTRYVNIDRQQWVNTVDPGGEGKMDIGLVDESVVRSLRSIFVGVNDKRGGINSDLDDVPTELDGKSVLIVDEVFSTGRTLTIAKKFFERAFPTTKVAGAYWMSGIAQKGFAVGNADIPVWYKDKDVTGRGVDNRDERRSQRSSSVTQRLGGWFLSTAFKEADPNSLQLRKEVKQLANDPNVLIIPSYQRDDLQERILALNNMQSIEEFTERKQALDKQK